MKALFSSNTDASQTTLSPQVYNTSCSSFTVDSTWFPQRAFLYTRCSKLPRLLDEKGPGRVGLLHRRAHLAVPHAHRCLWKVVAQLQTRQAGVHYPQGSVTNPVCSVGNEFDMQSKNWFFWKENVFCLPCREFLPGECQLVASCWRWRGTCCKITGVKYKFHLTLKQISVIYMVKMLLHMRTY